MAYRRYVISRSCESVRYNRTPSEVQGRNPNRVAESTVGPLLPPFPARFGHAEESVKDFGLACYCESVRTLVAYGGRFQQHCNNEISRY